MAFAFLVYVVVEYWCECSARHQTGDKSISMILKHRLFSTRDLETAKVVIMMRD